jgi:hypothetical protein
MRVSGLVFAALLLVSATLVAQHSSSGGGGSSSGSSHSSSSGGFSSSASSAGSHTFSSSASHASTSAPSHSSASSKTSSTKASAAPEKKSSFWHPFKKATPVKSAELKPATPCLKGQCPVCPRGQSRNGNGPCVTASNACSSGQSWNGFSCGTQGLFNDCNALARELAEQKRQMQSQTDYGQSLRYRLLQQQYEQCLRRSRSPFGAYAFNSALLLDTP